MQLPVKAWLVPGAGWIPIVALSNLVLRGRFRLGCCVGKQGCGIGGRGGLGWRVGIYRRILSMGG